MTAKYLFAFDTKTFTKQAAGFNFSRKYLFRIYFYPVHMRRYKNKRFSLMSGWISRVSFSNMKFHSHFMFYASLCPMHFRTRFSL